MIVITSGTGPLAVRTFVRLLCAKLTEALEKKGMEVLSEAVSGDPNYPRSMTLHVAGQVPFAVVGWLGTHALYAPELGRARSKGSKARSRWFAGIEMMAVPTVDRAPIREQDIRFEAIRSRGPGGQHINKRATAVRATHLPSQTTVRVDTHRSRQQNQTLALRLLQQALTAKHQEADTLQEHRKHKYHHQFERGNPIAVWRLAASMDGIELQESVLGSLLGSLST